jgi:hypothetical protein
VTQALTANSFEELSERAVRAFLQNALLVDDEARDGSLDEPTKLITPEASQIAPETETVPAAPSGGPGIIDHPLDAAALVMDFAALGVVAAVLRPTTEAVSEMDSAILAASKRVDVLVMDWSLNADGGERATRLIEQILEADGEDQRLRLIVMYTGEDLAEVSERLREKLTVFSASQDPFSLVNGGTSIVLLAKDEGQALSDAAERRRTAAKDLPARIIAEFSLLTAGLLSNLALAALASVRANTHQLLNRFRAEIDRAYIGDVILRGDSGGSSDMAIALVTRELRTIVNHAHLGTYLDGDAVRLWLNWAVPDGKITHTAPGASGREVIHELTLEQAEGIIREGLKAKPEGFPKLPHTAALFPPGAESAAEIEHEYAMLTMLDRNHADVTAYRKGRKPELTLGAVVERTDGEDRKFFICTQAVCNSVRLEAARRFPLSPVDPSVATIDDFDLAFVDGGDTRRYGIVDLDNFSQEMVSFAPDTTSRTVRAQLNGDAGWQFTDEVGVSYRWLGQLREEQAQRIVNSLAREAARVGLDETEHGSRSRRKRLRG